MCKFCAPPNKSTTLRHWYEVFQLKEDVATKIVDFTKKSYHRVLKTLSLKKLFYFLTESKLQSYSTLTKAWKTLPYDSFKKLYI